MIGSLSGVVRGSVRGSIIVDVQGVGYRVSLTADALTRIREGEHVELFTHLAVRENALDLYGFLDNADLQWFELLITVSGVGPKSALAILNAVDTRTLETAIGTNDAASLARAHGVGKKTAEKVVLELREKVGTVEKTGTDTTSGGDVIDALVGLGYSQKEARDAARSLPSGLTTTEERIREAIKIASRAPVA